MKPFLKTKFSDVPVRSWTTAMNQVCSLLALGSALGCSGGNPASTKTLDATDTTEAAGDVRESAGGRSPNSMESGGDTQEPSGMAGAPNASVSAGGSPRFAEGGASSVGASNRPGKLAPTREAAQTVLDRITAMYQDYAAAAPPQGTHRLIGRIRDDDPLPHAHTLFGENWEIYATPGWLTYPAMTLDIFSLTSCHEMGHLVGGFPFKGGSPLSYGSASAGESQADYFATKDCLPRLWANELDSNAAAFAELDSYERGLCVKAHSDPQGQQLCARMLITAVQAAPIFHKEYLSEHNKSASTEPNLETPDPTLVTATDTGPVNAHCRLDTMVAGIQCDVKAVGTTVPGYLPADGHGAFSPESQEAARPFACQEGAGARPRCWFQPDTAPVDCTGFESPQCVVENGQPGIRSCDTKRGFNLEVCASGNVCVDSGEFTSCIIAGT